MANRWDNPPAFLESGDPESENNVTMSYPGQLGTRFTVHQPSRTAASSTTEAGHSKSYQFIRTDSTMSVSPFPGAVAWWSDKSQYLVTTTVTTLGRGRVAGVFQNAITKGNYGCIQIRGLATVKFVDGVTSAPDATGKFVIPSATNGKADCLAAGSTSALYPVLGLSASAYNAVDATAIVDLNVPETT